MKTHSGFFISFEKTKEGLGGTTQANKLYDNLRGAGYEVVLTREPGGTRLGREIRKLLLDPEYNREGMSKATELFLFMADRAQHYKEVIKPALKQGKIVITDRYFDTTLAYQGSGRGWKNAFLWRLHHASTGSLLPDLTFVLDGEAYRPLSSEDRIEGEGVKFHERVERGMKHIVAKNQHDRYRLVLANTDVDTLADHIFQVVQQRMGEVGYR